MSNIKYVGPSDYQGFGPGDFLKQGLETEESYYFPKGRSVEVPDEVAELLLDGGVGVFEGFEFEVTDEEPYDPNAPVADVPEPFQVPQSPGPLNEQPQVSLDQGTPMGPIDPVDPDEDDDDLA